MASAINLQAGDELSSLIVGNPHEDHSSSGPVAHPVLLMLLVVCVAAASSVTTLAMLVSVRVP